MFKWVGILFQNKKGLIYNREQVVLMHTQAITNSFLGL